MATVFALAAVGQMTARVAIDHFGHLYRGGHVGITALTAAHVARMAQRRATLASLDDEWGAHSLRSGFVTEAGRQGVPLGEVVTMTEHRGVGTVMGYVQVGHLLSSRATDLFAGGADVE